MAENLADTRACNSAVEKESLMVEQMADWMAVLKVELLVV